MCECVFLGCVHISVNVKMCVCVSACLREVERAEMNGSL